MYIDRIHEVNPIINAMVDERFDAALKEARVADSMVHNSAQRYLLDNYPLLGVPFTAQEAIGVTGLQHAAGTLQRGKKKATEDGDGIRLLRAAGAIPIGVTNVSESCVSSECYNHLNGRTLNPYDRRRTPGGACGGEAALNATGGSLFGVGNDIIGDIRVPAHFCGVFGHKPTPGLIGLNGFIPSGSDSYRNLASVGLITRYATDLKPLLDIMTDRFPMLRLDEPVSIQNVKIYHKHSFNDLKVEAVRVSSSIKASLSAVIEYFQYNGNFTEEVKIDLSQAINIGTLLFMDTDTPDVLGPANGTKRDSIYLEIGKNLIGKSQHTFLALCKFLTF